MSGNPQHEPSAVQREGARELFGMFNALLLEGFSEKQALQLIGAMLAANAEGDPA